MLFTKLLFYIMPQTLACGQFVVGEDDGVSEFLNSKGLFGRLTVDGEVVLVRVNECYCADMISGFLRTNISG